MSFNTWCLSLTKVENLPDERVLEIGRRLHHMMSVYTESCTYGGRLEQKPMKELEKCQVQLDRVDAELRRRGLL